MVWYVIASEKLQLEHPLSGIESRHFRRRSGVFLWGMMMEKLMLTAILILRFYSVLLIVLFVSENQFLVYVSQLS